MKKNICKPDYDRSILSISSSIMKNYGIESEYKSLIELDDILKNRVPKDWTDEQKTLAIRIGIERASENIYVEKLVSIGYSESLARYFVKNDFTDIALSVGSQEGLSMDMKVWAIFNSNINRK